MHDAPPFDKDLLRSQLEEHHEECFGWALACCAGRRHHAEDALQAAYLKVLEGRARFAGRSSFRTWIFGVIRLSALEQYRRGFRNRIFGFGVLRAEEVDMTTGADDLVIASETTTTVRRALARLSPRQRQVLHLVFYHDFSIEDAAAVLGVAVGTARTHYERGKAMLRKRLDGGNR